LSFGETQEFTDHEGNGTETAVEWSLRYRLISYIRSALWVVPLIAVALEQVTSRLVHAIGLWLQASTGFLDLSIAGAQALLQTIITITLSFMVFTFGSLLVAIQVASGQYTPWIIATTLLRDNTVRYIVGLFIFTLLFALKALNRINYTVDQFSVFVAGLLGALSLAAFLFLIDYAARMLRPVALVRRVATEGFAAIEDVYPKLANDPQRPGGPRQDLAPRIEAWTITAPRGSFWPSICERFWPKHER
jgi:uncharacterized membrane protein